jgi:hypothetical protein
VDRSIDDLLTALADPSRRGIVELLAAFQMSSPAAGQLRAALRSWLEEVEAFWSAQLRAFSECLSKTGDRIQR